MWDANNCVQVFTDIGVGLLTADLDDVKPACAQDLGSITATPNLTMVCASPNLPYNYRWANAQGLQLQNGPSATLNNIAAGTYFVTISDNGGASISTDYTLEAVSALTVTAEVTSVDFNGFEIRCFDGTNGEATAFPANGAGNTYSYLWSNGKTTKTIDSLAAGNYTVTVSDGEECEMTASVTLRQPDSLTATTTSSNSGCTEGNHGQATVIVGGGVPPYTYLWSNGAETPTANNLPKGLVSVTVRDFNGCSMVKNEEVPVSTELSVLGFSVPDSGGPNGQAGVIVSGGTWPFTFTWQDFPSATDSVITELFPGEYLVLVEDANDCQVARVVDVDDETLCGEVRTVITPEGDGKNEEFIIQCLNRFNDNTLEIFNRWGQLVYSVEDYNDDNLWRGTTTNGDDVPEGVYYYVFNYFDPGINTFVTKKGSVTLLRK
ncbi:MAG: gliding motility-associated C-terminal domain-containing protein [Saprospiraceae bacterium]|nr:gliding motility-associated C-terminal domain-containing protein [Saprospiraceae bacterium]